MYGGDPKHRFSSSNLDERSIATEDTGVVAAAEQQHQIERLKN